LPCPPSVLFFSDSIRRVSTSSEVCGKLHIRPRVGSHPRVLRDSPVRRPDINR
jgi:hypothetical protein